MGKLQGKVAIITGATSGMGRDTAYLFAEEGAKVIITGRNEERAKQAVEKIRENGGEADYVIADMSDRSQLKKIVDYTLEKYGTVDILFNNAGLLSITPTLSMSEKEWDDVMQVNVTSALTLTQLVAPIMKEKGKGAVINTGSIAGTSARWGPVAYCTSKHAINGLTRALARELGPEIRVNAILPGAIRTAMLDSVGGEETMSGMIEMAPLKRIGEGREIATSALFLASDDSSFITGQLLRVDGGIDC
ncbi:MAG TPA: glucose 1-dehydrogenase [Tissierellia bacterium]|jgi:3-oxoacyl-[acyl-carrier protein] reductase|nr:glucose 1-dehydrogenase [Tissierellia bacterium]